MARPGLPIRRHMSWQTHAQAQPLLAVFGPQGAALALNRTAGNAQPQAEASIAGAGTIEAGERREDPIQIRLVHASP